MECEKVYCNSCFLWDRDHYKPRLGATEKYLMHQFVIDPEKQFSDIQICAMQNRYRFEQLTEAFGFPIMQHKYISFELSGSLNSEDFDRYIERELQRRFCVKKCYWNPQQCFYLENHTGKLEDLMHKEFHQELNPDFVKLFQINKHPKLQWERLNSRHPRRFKYPSRGLRNLIQNDLGIWSKLSYDKDGLAINFNYFKKEYREYGDQPDYQGRPLYHLEMKKCFDIIFALIASTEDFFKNLTDEAYRTFTETIENKGSIRKPILSQMGWGPMPFNKKITSRQNSKCRFEERRQVFLAEEYKKEKLHSCNYFLNSHYWEFSHGENVKM